MSERRDNLSHSNLHEAISDPSSVSVIMAVDQLNGALGYKEGDPKLVSVQVHEDESATEGRWYCTIRNNTGKARATGLKFKTRKDAEEAALKELESRIHKAEISQDRRTSDRRGSRKLGQEDTRKSGQEDSQDDPR